MFFFNLLNLKHLQHNIIYVDSEVLSGSQNLSGVRWSHLDSGYPLDTVGADPASFPWGGV